jgi:peptidoglycan hydrolase-like protein with peptidoglycan-binding domain
MMVRSTQDRGVVMARLNQTTTTVVNNTTSTLTKVDEGHFEGGPITGAPQTIGPNQQFTFATREQFGESEKGDDGFVTYDIGGAGRTFWQIHWSNVETGTSRATGSLFGDDAARFDVADDIPPEGGDVAATFTLSDAPRLDENDFFRDKPAEADEPTLRFGDESVDGWVEYLQRLLTVKGHPVDQNGSFDNDTLIAVRAFQDQMNRLPNTPSTGRVFVDGVVGNQTWALLREEDAVAPSTDGRAPHSFVEQGREARWLTEDSAFVFLADDDRLVIQGVSTGDTPLESGVFNARFLIVLPNAETVVRDRPIFTANGQPAPPGGLIFAEFDGAAERSRNVPDPLETRSFSFQAFMPAELGGDTTQSFSVPFA